MDNKELAQKNHEKGLWSDEMLDALVAKGKLTKSEKDSIKATTLSKKK